MANGRIDENGLPVYAPGDYDYVRVVDRSTGASRNALAPEITAAARAISGALDQIVADAEADIAPVIAGLGYLPPVPYASGLNVESTRFTVIRDGQVYAPAAPVPFTTGAWDAGQWRLIQGVTGGDLASEYGAGMVGFKQAGAGAELRSMLEKARESLSVKDFGAIGNGVANDHPAIIAAFNAAKAAGRSVYFPSGTYLVNDSFTIDASFSNMTIFGDGPSSCIKFANSLNYPANLGAGWMFMLHDTENTIRNFRLSGLRLDGSRHTIVHPTTSHGVVAVVNSLLEGVQIDNMIAHSFLYTGFHMLVGGARWSNLIAYDNGLHGLGVSIGASFGNGEAEVDGITAYDNGGLGVDVSKGRCIISRIVSYRNGGGMKTSEDCEFLKMDDVVLIGNIANGFQTTGDAPDMLLIADNVYAEGNGGKGFRIATGKKAKVGSLVCVGNNVAGEPDANEGDVYISMPDFTAESIYVEGSEGAGVSLTGEFNHARFGSIEAVNCGGNGVRVTHPSTAATVSIGDLTLRGNNKRGISGTPGGAAFFSYPGTAKIGRGLVEDVAAVPTQVSGIHFASAVKGHVDAVHFGAGLADGSQVTSSNAGTTVTFGSGNTGIVTRARGIHTGNGGGSTITFNFDAPMTSFGGAVRYAQFSPASPDARGDAHISALPASGMSVNYASATPAGTANISIRYDAETEIRR